MALPSILAYVLDGDKPHILLDIRVDPLFFLSIGDFYQEEELPTYCLKVQHKIHHISYLPPAGNCCASSLCHRHLAGCSSVLSGT